MSFICVFVCPPRTPKTALVHFPTCLLSPFSVFCPPVPAFHSRNYGNGTEVITGVEVG